MKTRRRISEYLIFLVTASVFLFSSCGIPTFCSFADAYTINSQQTSSSTLELNVSLTDDENIALLSDGPGLVLFYVITESVALPSQDYGLRSGFLSEYGGDQTFGKKLVRFSDSVSTISKEDSSDKTRIYNLCGFTLGGVKAGAPSYHLNLNSRTSSQTSVSFQLVEEEGGCFVKMNNSINLGRFSSSSTLFPNTTIAVQNINSSLGATASDYNLLSTVPDNGYYIHMYAAFVASEGDFSNIFWSSLKHIGYLQVPKAPIV